MLGLTGVGGLVFANNALRNSSRNNASKDGSTRLSDLGYVFNPALSVLHNHRMID